MKKHLKKLIIPILLITGLVAVRVYALTFTSKILNLALSTLGDSILEITHNYKSIFDEDYQKTVDKQIKQQLKNNSYTLEDPLLIYNPYGTNTLSLNIYFHDDKALTLSYLIEVEGEEDFAKTAYEEDTRDHAVQLIGLVPEKKNTYYNNGYL